MTCLVCGSPYCAGGCVNNAQPQPIVHYHYNTVPPAIEDRLKIIQQLLEVIRDHQLAEKEE